MKSARLLIRILPCCAFVLAGAVTGCGPRDATSSPAATIAKPATRDILTLTPEAAAIAIAIPSVDRSYGQVETLLLRAAPKNINMEAEIKVIVSQLAHGAGVYDATSVSDIALARGIDPAAPIGVFIAESKAGATPSPQDAQAPPPQEAPALNMQLLSRFGMDSLPPFAVVFTYAKRQDAEKLVADWGGSGHMAAQDLSEPKTTLYSRDDHAFAYFFTDKQLVAGTSEELVRGIAACMKTPAHIRYGTPECPAEDPDEIVQLVRTDKLPADAQLPLPAAIPLEARKAAGTAWSGIASSFRGADPMVITWRLGEDKLTIRSRLDYAQHPEAKANLAPPVRMAHLDALPKSTVAVYTMQFTPQIKNGLKNLLLSEGGAAGGLVGQITGSLTKVIDASGDEVTLAATGAGAKGSRMAALINFKNGDEARALLKELGMAPLVAETYNNTEIYSLILPSPAPIYYALPKDTFVLGGSVDTLKDLIDAVSSGKASGFAGSLNPPLDAQAPHSQVLVVKRDAMVGTFLPLLELRKTLPAGQEQNFATAFEKVRDLRLSTEVVNDWQDTRVTLQFD